MTTNVFAVAGLCTSPNLIKTKIELLTLPCNIAAAPTQYEMLFGL